jgi:hypothetical protein
MVGVEAEGQAADIRVEILRVGEARPSDVLVGAMSEVLEGNPRVVEVR